MTGSVVVSFVVPTRNSDRTIRGCLGSIRAQSLQPVELIVVDNASTDATFAEAAAVADLVITAGPERSAQRNIGARASGGEHIVFIDSDMVLEPEVASQVAAEFDRDPRLGGLVLPERSFGSGFWAECKVLEKRLYVGDSSVEAARAFRRSAFDEVGGYDPRLTGPEDWDLPDRIEEAGWVVGRIEAGVHHDEGRLTLAETFRKKRYYGRTVFPYVARHGRIGAQKALRSALFRQPSRFLREPRLSLGLLGLKAVEFTGIVVGVAESARRRRGAA